MLATCPHCHNAVDVGDGSAVMLCEYCGREFHPAATPVISAAAEPEPSPSLPEAPAPGPLAARPPAAEPARPPELKPSGPAPRPAYRLQISPEERAALGPRTQAAAAAAPPARHHPLATLSWSAGILVLAAALLLQYAYFMREDLAARHLALRPWLERLCLYARCEIPLLRDPAQVRIVARDIRRHPDAAGALRVLLTLENQAPLIQAYPVIQLSFFDFHDRLLARRRFTPQEYLSVAVNPGAGMPVRQPVQTTLDIADPGPEAVNFEFQLR